MTIHDCNIGLDQMRVFELVSVEKSADTFPANGFIYKSKLLSTDEITYYISTLDKDGRPVFGEKNIVMVTCRKQNIYVTLLISAEVLMSKEFALQYIPRIAARNFKKLENDN